VLLEGLRESKNPMISSGIEPATFLFVAWCLNHSGFFLFVLMDRCVEANTNNRKPEGKRKLGRPRHR
jgi:hypothetical protein